MNRRTYAFILLFLCMAQDAYCMRFFPYSSFIANIINNKWFMPTLVVTSLIASNALTYWHKNKQVIAAQHDVKTMQAQLKHAEDVGEVWIEKIKAIGVTVEKNEKEGTISFFNLSRELLDGLNKHMEKEGFKHREVGDTATYVNVRALDLQRLLDIEKEGTRLLQEEVAKLNQQIQMIRRFAKVVKMNIIIPDDFDTELLDNVFKIFERPLTKNNNNADKYSHFHDDSESGKRRVTISLQSQQPAPPPIKGVFSPPMQRRASDTQGKG